MKICLIRPPASSPINSFYTLGTYGLSQGPSIGLSLIAGQLLKHNHDVTVVDCLGEGINHFFKSSKYNFVINGLDLDQMYERIPRDVEVIGITMMFSLEWYYYASMVKYLKSKLPHVLIIAGGEHVSAEYENIYQVTDAIDFCVIGEGDETIIDLLETIENKGPIEKVTGIAYLKNGQFVKNPGRKRLSKIDDLALPAWELFPMDNYLTAKVSQSVTNKRAMPILASRGCPYMCSFCSNKDMWGTDFYLRSPELIVKEIKSYVEKYKIEHLDFCDAVGVLNKKWIVELLTRLKEEKLNITWLHGAGTRSEILDEEVLTLFKETGAEKVNYAPESGSPEVLKRINKRVNLSKMIRSMKIAIDKDLVVKTHIMYGLPGQNFQQIFKSMLFTFKMSLVGVADIGVHLFTAYPGTKDYQDLLKSGKIDMKKIIQEGRYADFLASQVYGQFNGIDSWTDDVPGWALGWLQFITYMGHYSLHYISRPLKIIKAFYNSIFKKNPITAIENTLFRIYHRTRGKHFSELQEFAE